MSSQNPKYEEVSYCSSDFSTTFDFLKKIIIDLSSETNDYDIIVKKRKISNNPQQSSSSMAFSSEINIKNRHKNCPKLFGRAFFRLLLKDAAFKAAYLTEENIRKLAVNGINYPKNSNEIHQKISISKFITWLKINNYHKAYNNLHFYREMWKYKEIEDTSEDQWVYQHYKFFLTSLMKEFFEVYAFEYVFRSKIHLKNGKKYLQLIPNFLRGIEDPESFTCLKFGNLRVMTKKTQ